METSNKKINLIVRYLILVVIMILGFEIFYEIFLPLTKYPVYYFLKIFFEAELVRNSIVIDGKSIDIIGACIGGAAYSLMLILNLATPKIKVLKRIKMILISFATFLIANNLRIIILSFMYLENSPLFEITHKILWYFGSTLFVVAIWFAEVYLFKINKIPFYSDIKHLYSASNLKRKNSQGSKKNNQSRNKNTKRNRK